MMITILSENGRGRFLSQWALERGFQVNMVLSENEDQSIEIQDLPFGEFVPDVYANWMQDYIDESKNAMKMGELVEVTKNHVRLLPEDLEKLLHTSRFDWNEIPQTQANKIHPLWKREWNKNIWQSQLEKMQRLGMEIRKEERVLNHEIIFDFRSDFRVMPLWQWCSFDFAWDPGLYADVIPSCFLWTHKNEEYLAYENFAFVQRAGKNWQVFLKIPYAREMTTQNVERVIKAWLKNLTQRWQWASAEWLGSWQPHPFYQWQKDAQRRPTNKRQASMNFYDVGPRMLGSWSFQQQWKLEQKNFKALTETSQQRKKKDYDFQILST